MLTKIKLEPSKGFLGDVETTEQAPYREVDRTPDMQSYGTKSYFNSPVKEEQRKCYPKGIKR